MQISIFRIIAATCAVALSAAVWAQPGKTAVQAYPTKPIRVIVNAAAGGSTDVTARSMATRLTEVLGQQVVIDNRVGAGGLIGVEIAGRAAPDGYTLLHASDAGILVSPHLYKMGIDVAKDLVSVSPTAKAALFFIVRANLPVKTLADFVAHARANPGKLNYGSAGHGTLQHIAAEMMIRETNVKIVHVAYKGSQQVLVDLLAGQVDFTFDLGAAIPHIKSGKVRALADLSGAADDGGGGDQRRHHVDVRRVCADGNAARDHHAPQSRDREQHADAGGEANAFGDGCGSDSADDAGAVRRAQSPRAGEVRGDHQGGGDQAELMSG